MREVEEGGKKDERRLKRKETRGWGEKEERKKEVGEKERETRSRRKGRRKEGN